MIKIKSEGEFQIVGRGLVKTVNLNKLDKKSLIELAVHGLYKVYEDREAILIDGEEVIIRGVESWAIPMAILATKPQFGLLIKKI